MGHSRANDFNCRFKLYRINYGIMTLFVLCKRIWLTNFHIKMEYDPVISS